MNKRGKNENKGFTLVELIVAMCIMVILLTITVSASTTYVEKAKQQQALINCRTAITSYQTLYAESVGENASLMIHQDKLKELMDIEGSIDDVDSRNGVLFHLDYTLKGTTVSYCRNYKTCRQHDKLYTLKDRGEE